MGYRDTLKRIKELAAKLQNSSLSASELRELQTLRKAKAEYEEQTTNELNEFRRQHPELLWQTFFNARPEITDNRAHRLALEDRALSLSDDRNIDLRQLNEAAKLLIAEGTIIPTKLPTAAETKKLEAQDRETFKTSARKYGFAENDANLKLIAATLGPGFSEYQISQGIQSNALQLAPVGPEEQQERDEQERSEILEEILGARIVTAQDKIHFESMPLQQLRSEVARIREERRLRSMTGSELRAHIRGQHRPVPVTTDLDDMSRDNILLSMQAAGEDRVKTTGKEDTRVAGEADYLRRLCRLHGWKAVEKKMGYAEPKIGGFVRTLRHEFDTESLIGKPRG